MALGFAGGWRVAGVRWRRAGGTETLDEAEFAAYICLLITYCLLSIVY
jgi:hypothetical protein